MTKQESEEGCRVLEWRVTEKATLQRRIGENGTCNPREESFRMECTSDDSQETKDAGIDWPWGKCQR